MSVTQQIIIIAIIAIATASTRAIPFLLFPDRKHTPRFIQFLGRYLASAVFGMLIVYCIKDISFLSGDHGLPQVIGILACVLLHLWRRNMFLTIAGGTAFYMVLIHLL